RRARRRRSRRARAAALSPVSAFALPYLVLAARRAPPPPGARRAAANGALVSPPLVDVGGVAAPDLVGELDGGERLLVRAGVLAGRPDADAGRGHERRRALRGRDRRIGAELEQRAQERDVAGLRGEQERR